MNALNSSIPPAELKVGNISDWITQRKDTTMNVAWSLRFPDTFRRFEYSHMASFKLFDDVTLTEIIDQSHKSHAVRS